MRGRIVYLDSSAIIKRYIMEPYSKLIRSYFINAYAGDIILAFNVWNIGEVLGIFDKARRIGRIDDETYNIIKNRFMLDVKRLSKFGMALVIPLRINILKNSWKIIERYHIYIADALQIVSAKHVNADGLISSDKCLLDIAKQEGINTIPLK